MQIRRRDFLKLGLAQAVLLGATTKASGQSTVMAVTRKTSPSIVQGPGDETHAQFSIVYDSKTNLDVFVANSRGQSWPADKIQPFIFKGQPQKVTKVSFSHLPEKEILFLQVRDAASGKVLDQREFQTCSFAEDRPLNFALCSCMDDAQHAPEIWRTMVAKRPDMLFFIGDSTYCDYGAPASGVDPAFMWQRFCEARMTLDIYYSKKLIPIIATWDDHDFGLNDSNSVAFPYVKESQDNFLTFFAQDPKYCRFMSQGPGVSSAYRFNNHLFLLLDDRSFRLPAGTKDRYAHWGQTQEAWLLDQMRQTTGPTWLMNGSQIFPAMPFKESLSANHPQQFVGIQNELKLQSSKVIFASGDVHYTEISKIEKEALGYGTYELTSSSIHSTNIPGVPGIIPNKRRIAGVGVRNYIMVENAVANGYGADFSAVSYDAGGKEKFRLKLGV